MSAKIVIGKHTLESLTSGMYSDPYVVYREYIQNAVDSIDDAIAKNVLNKGDENIVVQLSPTTNKISIRDNGMGIPASDAERILISIGNSKKTAEMARGFRGIGRLSALSYCRSLSFITSFTNERIGTRITIDAEKLASLLRDDSTDISVKEVLEMVYSVDNFSEKESLHYFEVVMEGVDSNSGLTDIEKVVDYLSQIVPVPYDPDFAWGKEIRNQIKKEGYEISEYNLVVKYGTVLTPIYKPYKDQMLVDKGRNISDCIEDIEIIKIPTKGKKLSAIGWIAKTNYLGSIYDKRVKGVRLRKGNIQIGDYQTLNVIFKDARFNGWALGEIFAIDNELVPNARRDNFEKNQTYFLLLEQLSTLSAKITKDIRSASMRRNKGLSKAIEKMDEASKLAINAIEQGANSSKRGAISQKLKHAQNAVSDSLQTGAIDDYQVISFDELDMLIGKLKGATEYKALNTIEKLSTTEKKILERVFHVIEEVNVDGSTKIVDAILDEFSK